MNFNSSRHKLNHSEIIGSIGIAALFAAFTNSAAMFIVIATALIGASIISGQIRIDGVNKR